MLAAEGLEKSTRAPLRQPGKNFITDSDLEFGSGSGIMIPYNNKDYLKTSSFSLSITQIPANMGGEG